MDNSLKGLLLAAGTIITCLVVGLGFYIAREAKNTAANGASQLSKLNAEFNENDKAIYDGLRVSGSEIINVIQKFEKSELGILVKTKKSTVCYGYLLDEAKKALKEKSSAKVKDAKETTNQAYINPNAQFDAQVIRDENETIIGLSFIQVD